MKVLHSAFMAHAAPGIVRQMEWEQEAADQLGLPWTSRLLAPGHATTGSQVRMQPRLLSGSGLVSRASNWYRLRTHYYRWLESEAARYDVLMVRFSTSNPLQLRFLRRIRKPIVTVHHTLEEPELSTVLGYSRVVREAAEKYLGPRSLQRATALVGVTEEIIVHERTRSNRAAVPAFCYPNGIMYRPELGLQDSRGDVPEVLFVCSHFSPWQGLDLLLDSLASVSAPCLVHLVGKLSPDDESRARQDPRIRIHGVLEADQIAPLLHRSWVGLSSLALHRKKMTRACTLKVREYLMGGLPVYADHEDVFGASFPFFRRGPADLDAILQYARDMRVVAREVVSDAARPAISKRELLHGLYEWLERVVRDGSDIVSKSVGERRS